MTKGRYILLAGEHFYPSRWEDFRGTFNTVEEAKSFAEDCLPDVFLEDKWAQVIDKDNMKLVCECIDFIPLVRAGSINYQNWLYKEETKDD